MITITRDELKAITERAIAQTSDVPEEALPAVRKVAETAPFIAHNVWQMSYPGGYCGCLVGWLHDPTASEGNWVPGRVHLPDHDWEDDLGMAFHDELTRLLEDRIAEDTVTKYDGLAVEVVDAQS